MIKFLLAILLTLAPCFGQGMILNPYRFASGPFTPTSISGLAVWLDASDALTTFQDTALTTAATTDGTAVAGFKNKVGAGNTNAVQSTSTKRPLLKTAVYNSKNCLRFDGTDDCLQIASVSLPSHFSIFVVGKFTTSGYMFIEHSPNINPGPGFFFYGSGSGGMWDVTRAGVLHNAGGAAAWMTASLAQVDFRYDGAGEVRVNGSVVSNVSESGPARSNSFITDALNLMSRNQSSLFSNGDLCEVLIYDSHLDDSNAALVRGYLKSKWGTP